MLLEKEFNEVEKMSLEGFDDSEYLDKILNNIAENGNEATIIDICLLLNDNIKHPSIGYDLVKAIFYIGEKYDLEKSMILIVKGICKMIPKGKDWAIIITRMIIDSEELIVYYKSAIEKCDNSTKLIIYDVLEYVKEDDNEYSQKIDDVIMECF